MTAEFKKCWMLKIYTGEDVIVGNDPLYRTILEEARRLKIAGARSEEHTSELQSH